MANTMTVFVFRLGEHDGGICFYDLPLGIRSISVKVEHIKEN